VPISVLMTKRRTARVAVFSADNKLLVVRPWLGLSHYILPGGGIHYGEPSDVAAIRECTEETGLVLPMEDMCHLGLTTFKNNGLRCLADFYTVSLNDDSSEVKLRPQKYEILEAQWLSLDGVDETKLGADVRCVLNFLAAA
jgi:8-oxo-dGTP pyrophosphatase MutT (NUDIX family)